MSTLTSANDFVGISLADPRRSLVEAATRFGHRLLAKLAEIAPDFEVEPVAKAVASMPKAGSVEAWLYGNATTVADKTQEIAAKSEDRNLLQQVEAFRSMTEEVDRLTLARSYRREMVEDE